jgi:uncharacterized integral membrane protein
MERNAYWTLARDALPGDSMPLRSILLILTFAVLVLFVVVNWGAFTTPTSLSLIVGSVEAPLGIIMLGVTAFVTAIFLAYALYLQTTVLLETRRMTRELAAQRQLADQAEASRFTELRTSLDGRLERLEAALRDGRTPGVAAPARVVDELRAAIDQAANGLAAQIAELDDRIGRR